MPQTCTDIDIKTYILQELYKQSFQIDDGFHWWKKWTLFTFKCALMSKAMTCRSVPTGNVTGTVCVFRLLLKLRPNIICCVPCERYSKYTTLHILNPIKDVATNHKDVATITIPERESNQNNASRPHVFII